MKTISKGYVTAMETFGVTETNRPTVDTLYGISIFIYEDGSQLVSPKKPPLERELVLSNVTINGGEDRYKPLSWVGDRAFDSSSNFRDSSYPYVKCIIIPRGNDKSTDAYLFSDMIMHNSGLDPELYKRIYSARSTPLSTISDYRSLIAPIVTDSFRGLSYTK